mgnify:CR=1 FL=1
MWKTMKLDDIASLTLGKTPSRSNQKFWDKEKNSKNIWLSIADLSASNQLYIEDSKEYLSDEGAKLFKEVPAETLIMSFKLSIGKLAITKCALRTNEAIIAMPIKDKKLISKEYLYYFLSSMNWDTFAGNDIKVKGKTLNKAKLKELPILVPPLPEQQRIVAKLDATFAQIDVTLNATKNNLYKLDKFRRLYLSVEMNKADNDYKLGEICELEKNQGNFKNMIYVGMEDIESGTGKFIGDMQPKEVKSKTFRFGSNNLLYGRLRPYLNKVLLPDFDGHCSTEIYPIKLGKKILREYLFYWFIQDKTVDAINSSTTGARMPRANLNKILEMKINLPSLEQQRRALNGIINIDKKITTIKDVYSIKLIELRNLKKAVLLKVLQEKAIN